MSVTPGQSSHGALKAFKKNALASLAEAVRAPRTPKEGVYIEHMPQTNTVARRSNKSATWTPYGHGNAA